MTNLDLNQKILVNYSWQLIIINFIAKGIDNNLQIDVTILRLLIELPIPDFSINWTTMV